MLDEGTTAPDFRLPGVDDGELGEFSLGDLAADHVVVLAFYPADFSPTCTDELCSLQDLVLFGLQREVSILGISPDSPYSHRAFASEYGLEGIPRVPKRSVFVVDERRRIRYAWSTDDPTVLPDVTAVRDAIAAVKDDRTAVDRYAAGHEAYTEGRAAFESALSAYEDADWDRAATAFGEAVPTLDRAAQGFDSATRFAESDAVDDRAGRARERADALRRAAKWYAESARRYADGETEWGDEYRSDAKQPHDEAREYDEPLDPESLSRAVEER